MRSIIYLILIMYQFYMGYSFFEQVFNFLSDPSHKPNETIDSYEECIVSMVFGALSVLSGMLFIVHVLE